MKTIIFALTLLAQVSVFNSGRFYHAVAFIPEQSIIETQDGNLWEVFDTDLIVGSRVEVVFNDMGTESIYDDEIVCIDPIR